MNDSIPLLDLRREYEQIAAELQQQWAVTLERMQLLNGEQVRLFEEEIAAYVGVPHARGVASGTDALLLGMTAAGIRPGDRVIVPANAFVADMEAIHHLGAVPVLVDTAENSIAPDIEAIEASLPAAAVLIVHLYGHCLDLTRLLDLCRRHGAHLVEDAAHAHGAARDGHQAGSFGMVGCFSAGIVKNLAAYGDAGFVTTADEKIAQAVTLLQRHGQQRKNDHVVYGYNSRLDEMQAAVLRVKLRHLDARNARRRSIADHYNDAFSHLGIGVPREDPGERAVYHQYVIRTPERDRLQSHLRERGIDTGVHYPVPLHRQPAWLRGYGEAPPLPRCERLAAEILSLPVFPDLTEAEVERVTAGVVSFFQ
jgi:dTDP-4-amino-4,6-dideoxygalactose transaminase